MCDCYLPITSMLMIAALCVAGGCERTPSESSKESQATSGPVRIDDPSVRFFRVSPRMRLNSVSEPRQIPPWAREMVVVTVDGEAGPEGRVMVADLTGLPETFEVESITEEAFDERRAELLAGRRAEDDTRSAREEASWDADLAALRVVSSARGLALWGGAVPVARGSANRASAPRPATRAQSSSPVERLRRTGRCYNNRDSARGEFIVCSSDRRQARPGPRLVAVGTRDELHLARLSGSSTRGQNFSYSFRDAAAYRHKRRRTFQPGKPAEVLDGLSAPGYGYDAERGERALACGRELYPLEPLGAAVSAKILGSATILRPPPTTSLKIRRTDDESFFVERIRRRVGQGSEIELFGGPIGSLEPLEYTDRGFYRDGGTTTFTLADGRFVVFPANMEVVLPNQPGKVHKTRGAFGSGPGFTRATADAEKRALSYPSDRERRAIREELTDASGDREEALAPCTAALGPAR